MRAIKVLQDVETLHIKFDISLWCGLATSNIATLLQQASEVKHLKIEQLRYSLAAVLPPRVFPDSGFGHLTGLSLYRLQISGSNPLDGHNMSTVLS